MFAQSVGEGSVQCAQGDRSSARIGIGPVHAEGSVVHPYTDRSAADTLKGLSSGTHRGSIHLYTYVEAQSTGNRRVANAYSEESALSYTKCRRQLSYPPPSTFYHLRAVVVWEGREDGQIG